MKTKTFFIMMLTIAFLACGKNSENQKSNKEVEIKSRNDILMLTIALVVKKACKFSYVNMPLELQEKLKTQVEGKTYNFSGTQKVKISELINEGHIECTRVDIPTQGAEGPLRIKYENPTGFSSRLNNEILFISGNIGINPIFQSSELIIGEGTIVIMDSERLMYSNGKWMAIDQKNSLQNKK